MLLFAAYAATIRMIIPRYEDEGMIWGLLAEETGRMKLVEADPCLCAVTYLDGEYKEKDVDMMAWKTVKGNYLDTQHLPGADAEHHASYMPPHLLQPAGEGWHSCGRGSILTGITKHDRQYTRKDRAASKWLGNKAAEAESTAAGGGYRNWKTPGKRKDSFSVEMVGQIW